MRQGVRLRHVRFSPRDARVTTPKYRTDLTACSCLGYWWRRTCRHIIAYREAVAMVEAQNAVNLALGYPKGRKRRCTGLSEGHLRL